MLGELITLMKEREIIAIYGNHDCAGTALDDHDSLSLLVKAGAIRLIDSSNPWRGMIRERRVVVGGSSWRTPVPRSFDVDERCGEKSGKPLVIWLAHHDVITPGYDAGRMASREIAAVELVVNGHIHRRLEPVRRGSTLWLTPGNISRRSRSSVARSHLPAALRIDVWPDRFEPVHVEIPHQPADDVFHESVVVDESETATSRFVEGLRELQLRRTDTGAGLHQFLEQNLDQFSDDVACEIRRLATLLTGTEAHNV
jgi:Calcineurin-like phosphoesterase superfamily domain